MGGLIKTMELEADTKEQLQKAIEIALVWDKKVTHYQTGVDVHGTPYLSFRWAADPGGTPLIAPMSNSEAIAEQIFQWLKTAQYNNSQLFGGDGDDVKGFRFSSRSPKLTDGLWHAENFYDVFTVYPQWIHYGK